MAAPSTYTRRTRVEIESAAICCHIALLSISNERAMQIALGRAGILVTIAAASLLSSIEIKPRRRP
jgi:hypothetical protein